MSPDPSTARPRASLILALLATLLVPGLAQAGPFHKLCARLLAGDQGLRERAAGQILARHLGPALVDEDAVAFAPAALRMEQPLVVIDAAFALIEAHGHPHGADVIVAMLWRRDGELRERALSWVERHPAAAMEFLGAATARLDAPTRARITPLVIEQLDSLDPKQRSLAIEVVGAGAIVEGRPLLLALISEDPELAFEALIAMEQVDPRWMKQPPTAMAAPAAAIIDLQRAVRRWDGVLQELRGLAGAEPFVAAHLRLSALRSEAQVAEFAGRPAAAARATGKATQAQEELRRLSPSRRARELMQRQASAGQQARDAWVALPKGPWRRYGEWRLAGSTLYF